MNSFTHVWELKVGVMSLTTDETSLQVLRKIRTCEVFYLVT